MDERGFSAYGGGAKEDMEGTPEVEEEDIVGNG